MANAATTCLRLIFFTCFALYSIALFHKSQIEGGLRTTTTTTTSSIENDESIGRALLSLPTKEFAAEFHRLPEEAGQRPKGFYDVKYGDSHGAVFFWKVVRELVGGGIQFWNGPDFDDIRREPSALDGKTAWRQSSFLFTDEVRCISGDFCIGFSALQRDIRHFGIPFVLSRRTDESFQEKEEL
eukprot:g2766.t1